MISVFTPSVVLSIWLIESRLFCGFALSFVASSFNQPSVLKCLIIHQSICQTVGSALNGGDHTVYCYRVQALSPRLLRLLPGFFIRSLDPFVLDPVTARSERAAGGRLATPRLCAGHTAGVRERRRRDPRDPAWRTRGSAVSRRVDDHFISGEARRMKVERSMRIDDFIRTSGMFCSVCSFDSPPVLFCLLLV